VNADNFCFIFDSYNPIKAGHSMIELLNKMKGYFASQVHIKDGVRGIDGLVNLNDGDGQLSRTLSELIQQNWINYTVLENDYRDGNQQRLESDIHWLSNFLNCSNTTWYRSKHL